MQEKINLIILLSFVGLLHLIYLFRYWVYLAFYKNKRLEVSRNILPVSVIIAARNEENNLRNNLKSILEQDYPTFEVIVVNDCSVDETNWVLDEYLAAYPEILRVVTLIEQPKYPTGKKFALTLGIKASKYDVLLFTDADSKPIDNQWIKVMQGHFVQKREIVLGYSPYLKEPTLLNLVIQFDTFLTGLNYLSYALAKNAYMGVGRNLAYLKGLFYYHKGFSAHIKHYAGDDDLFVNQAATKTNVAICINPEAMVHSVPKRTWTAWYYQKTRHASTAKFYKSIHQFSLFWGPFTFYSLVVLYLIFFISNNNLFIDWWYCWLPLSIVMAFRWFLMARVAFKLHEKRVLFFLPFLELFFPIIQCIFTINGLLKKSKNW